MTSAFLELLLAWRRQDLKELRGRRLGFLRQLKGTAETIFYKVLRLLQLDDLEVLLSPARLVRRNGTNFGPWASEF